MRRLLLLLCLASAALAAGLEYGGLTTIVPGSPSLPAAYFSISTPRSELYYTFTVPEPGGKEWYSYDITFSVPVGSTDGMCLEIAPAAQLSYAADCKSCSAVTSTYVFPQPGQWFVRVTNCNEARSTEAGVRLAALIFSAVICPVGMTGPSCSSPITILPFNATTQVSVKSTDSPIYFTYAFDQIPNLAWVNFYHNLTYNPVTAGESSYSFLELTSTLLQRPRAFPNEVEGTEFLDISDWFAPSAASSSSLYRWAPADYDIAWPTGKNVVVISNVETQGLSPADHALTLLAEAYTCQPPYFGEHKMVYCPYYFTGDITVDPTQATQTLYVQGKFSPNDIHSHGSGQTQLYQFFNLTLPATANLIYVTRTSGDAVVSLAYNSVGSAYGAVRSVYVATAGTWIVGVTSPTNSSFELAITVESCPDVCSKLGTCLTASTTCECPGGYIGPICQASSMLDRDLQVTIPSASWAFYELIIPAKVKEITITVMLTGDPSGRVSAFASFGGQFSITTQEISSLPFVFNNDTNSFTYPTPPEGALILAVYNGFGKDEEYVITSSVWGPTSPPKKGDTAGVNVVTTMVIIFLGMFLVILSVIAWVRWAAARGGYVSVR